MSTFAPKPKTGGFQMPKWAGILCARFARPVGFDFQAWQTVIEQDLGKFDEDEVCTVLQWMQSPGQSWTPTTAKALMVAIRTYRKDQRNDAPKASCSLCADSKGWISWWADWQPTWTIQDYAYAYRATIPCSCSAGDKLCRSVLPYREYKDQHKEELRRNREKAAEQNIAMNKLCGMESKAEVKGEEWEP